MSEILCRVDHDDEELPRSWGLTGLGLWAGVLIAGLVLWIAAIIGGLYLLGKL